MELTIFIIGCVLSWIIAWKTGSSLFHRGKDSLNPLEWPDTDRCLLLIMIYFVLGGATGFMGGIRSLFRVGHVPWVNFRFWDVFLPALIVLGLVLLILWLVGLYLRGSKRKSRIYVHTVVQFSAVVMASVCYVFGPITDPKGFIIGLAQGAVNFILFGFGVAIPWAVTYTLLAVALMTGVWSGLIPYAPFYEPTAWLTEKLEGLYWISMLAQELMLFLLLLFLIAFIVARWRDREKKLEEMSEFLRKMFGRYLSTEVMSSLIKDPSALELGGERRSVTIMMTDLRGFTALSERLEPERIVQMLNTYFEVMVDVILKYNGNINEIIGDALLIIFGAPQEMPDRARQAIACAIEMQNAMARVNDENRKRKLPELQMGIGLNETDVIVGNIGSPKRSKYAVVGSGVNMTSRIESYTVGGQILISESVRREAGEVLRIDAQRNVVPKGSETPLRIYEVGGIAGGFNLVLEKKEAALVTLERQIPFLYRVIDETDIEKEGLEGYLVRLSNKCAEITTATPVAELNNLRMNLVDVDEKLSVRDFYGKVVGRSEGKGTKYIVYFNSVPPEVDAYFQALQQYNTKA